MRILSLVLCLSFGLPGFAQSSSTVPADKELWQTLGELNTRAHVARTGRVATGAFNVSALSSLISFPVALFAHNRHPRLFKGAAVVSAVSWVATTFFISMELGSVLADRMMFDPQGRVLSSANDPKHLAVKALFAFDDFFSKSPYEQYVVASEDRELRGYLIRLNQWIKNGVQNAPAPTPPELK